MAASATAGSPISQALAWPWAMTHHSNASIAVLTSTFGCTAARLSVMPLVAFTARPHSGVYVQSWLPDRRRHAYNLSLAGVLR